MQPLLRRVYSGVGGVSLPPAQFSLVMMIVRSDRTVIDLDAASAAVWPDPAQRPTIRVITRLVADLGETLRPFGFQFEVAAETIRVSQRPIDVRILPTTRPRRTRKREATLG